jgi:outer membrane murein-binding lipoprotein Lpp
MNDIDYQALLSAYQKKVSELSNQVVVYEAKINSLSSIIGELNDKIQKLENQKSTRKKVEISSEDFQ